MSGNLYPQGYAQQPQQQYQQSPPQQPQYQQFQQQYPPQQPHFAPQQPQYLPQQPVIQVSIPFTNVNTSFPYNTHYFPSPNEPNTHHMPGQRDPRVLASVFGLAWAGWACVCFFDWFIIMLDRGNPWGFICTPFLLFPLVSVFYLFYTYKLFMGVGPDNAIIVTYPTEKPILTPPAPSTFTSKSPPKCLNLGTLSAQHRILYKSDNQMREMVRELSIVNMWGCFIFLGFTFFTWIAGDWFFYPLYYVFNIASSVIYIFYLNMVLVAEHDSREEWLKWNSFDDKGNPKDNSAAKLQLDTSLGLINPPVVSTSINSTGYQPYGDVEQRGSVQQPVITISNHGYGTMVTTNNGYGAVTNVTQHNNGNYGGYGGHNYQ